MVLLDVVSIFLYTLSSVLRTTSSQSALTLSLLITTIVVFNPLSHHDALKHHFSSSKKYLIFLQPRVLERKFL